jgi:hypothetical protein
MTLAALVAQRASATSDALLIADDRDRCLTALEFQSVRVAANLEKPTSWIALASCDARPPVTQ